MDKKVTLVMGVCVDVAKESIPVILISEDISLEEAADEILIHESAPVKAYMIIEENNDATVEAALKYVKDKMYKELDEKCS